MHSALGDPWQLRAVVRQSDLRLDLLARQAVSAGCGPDASARARRCLARRPPGPSVKRAA